MKNVCQVLGLRLESTHLREYEKTQLIYENVHFKSKAQHAPVCDNSTYAPRAQFTHVPAYMCAPPCKCKPINNCACKRELRAKVLQDQETFPFATNCESWL